MANHRVYRAIVKAVKNGRLKEPFDRAAFRAAIDERALYVGLVGGMIGNAWPNETGGRLCYKQLR